VAEAVPARKLSASWYLGLDYGAQRVGVAVGDSETGLARPLVTLSNNGDLTEQLSKLITQYHPKVIVVGLPRGLEGQETEQSRLVRRFTAEQLEPLGVAVAWQDEAMTSELAAGQLGRAPDRHTGEIDQRAAAIILQDYLDQL
jgi:putative pre-16S rRNA nuclease